MVIIEAFSAGAGAMLRTATVSVMSLLALTAPTGAQSVEEFYRGKTVNILVGFTAGGGYDLYARVLGRHLGRHIPGNPQVVVQNMPGAGSLKATQYVYGVAPKDGTTLATVSRGMATDPLLNDAKFDATKFTWIGSITSETSICATWQSSPTKTWDDMFRREFTLGGSAAGADPDTFALILRNVFGAKVKLVTGYPGGNDINLAMERGEVDGRCGWSWSSLKSLKAWLPKINLIAQFAVEKNTDIPQVPWAIERAANDEQRQVLRLLTAGQFLGRPFFGTPDIPADRTAALRTAFDATMKDAQFVAEAAKLDLEVTPVTGAAIDAFLADLYRTPKDVIGKAAAAIQK
jgi:tripartite-type tricarboxylate transporter receptor subunit TctC